MHAVGQETKALFAASQFEMEGVTTLYCVCWTPFETPLSFCGPPEFRVRGTDSGQYAVMVVRDASDDCTRRGDGKTGTEV